MTKDEDIDLRFRARTGIGSQIIRTVAATARRMKGKPMRVDEDLVLSFSFGGA
jgi:hypothetical protein